MIYVVGLVAVTCCSFVVDAQIPPQYHDYQTMLSELESLATNTCPGVGKMITLGTSVEGKDLLGLRLTRNAADDPISVAAPSVRLSGNLLGDEAVSREFLFALATYMCTQYGASGDPRVTWLVDNTQIYIVPSLNPDGFSRGVPGNAEGVDLNSDFPSRLLTGSALLDPEGRAEETAGIMSWSFAHYLTLAANFRGGALVASYPWDSSDEGVETTPDNSLFVRLANEYASASPIMKGLDATVAGGVANGGFLGGAVGTLQDWMVAALSVPEITVFMSKDKSPPAGDLPGYWDDHYEAALTYMFQAHNSIAGRVVKAEDPGAPVVGAVCVLDSVPTGLATLVNPVTGRFWRPVVPGTFIYELTCSAPGRTAIQKQITIPEYNLAVPPTADHLLSTVVTFQLPTAAVAPPESGLGAELDGDGPLRLWVGFLFFIQLLLVSIAGVYGCIVVCGGCVKKAGSGTTTETKTKTQGKEADASGTIV